MCVRCAEGVIHHHGKKAIKPNPAGLNAIGETEMLGKKFIYKRSVMIAIAVMALMTLTAGVAAAASLKAENIGAVGTITGLDLPAGSTVQSKFKHDKTTGMIKSVDIKTNGEAIEVVPVAPAFFVMSGCEPVGSDECVLAADLLNGGTVKSVHSSKAKLTVIGTTEVFPGVDGLVGFLKGSLKASLTFIPLSGDELTGKGKLKINSPEATPSVYACIGAGGIPTDVSDCVASKGKNLVGLEPVMIPVVLNVIDTGSFSIKNSSVKIKGDIEVTIGGAVSLITISNAEAKFKVKKEKP